MLEINLNMYHAVALGAIMFWVGRQLTSRIAVLDKFCIPAPLVGGLIFAIVNAILFTTNIAIISFDDTFGTLFNTMFFTSVGFSASVPALLKGSRAVFIVLAGTVVMICLQNGLGGAVMSLLGENPLYGIACGSLSLIGGPGTSAGIGPDLEAAGAIGATEIALASAVFGMTCGSLIGGPLARLLVIRHKLETPFSREHRNVLSEEEKKTIQLAEANSDEDGKYVTDGPNFLKAFLLMMLAMGIGDALSELLTSIFNISFPSYIGGMALGVVIRNVIEFSHQEFPVKEMDNLGNSALNIFLSMAVCGMELWQLIDLAGPMILTLLLQIILIFLVSYFALFRALGGDYDAAVTTAGFLGMGLGTASNAMVSMQAVSNKYGVSKSAYFAVPVAGIFMDFCNAALIAVNINLWS